MEPIKAVPPSPLTPRPPAPSSGTSRGTLTVRAGTGGRSYPLSGVSIEVYLPSPASDTPLLYRHAVTDESGAIEPISIPTPDPEASLSPGSPYLPYTVAQVRAYLEGYYTEEAVEVPVFPDTVSLQYFEMIPYPESNAYRPPSDTAIKVSEEIPDTL